MTLKTIPCDFPGDFGTLPRRVRDARAIAQILEGGCHRLHILCTYRDFDLTEPEGKPYGTTQEIVAAISKMRT